MQWQRATVSAVPQAVAYARVRAGYAMDKWLLYVNGGPAFAKIDNDVSYGGTVAKFAEKYVLPSPDLALIMANAGLSAGSWKTLIMSCPRIARKDSACLENGCSADTTSGRGA